MCIRDSRINYSGSFWGQGRYIKELCININGKENRIPLSRGINAVSYTHLAFDKLIQNNNGVVSLAAMNLLADWKEHLSV